MPTTAEKNRGNNSGWGTTEGIYKMYCTFDGIVTKKDCYDRYCDKIETFISSADPENSISCVWWGCSESFFFKSSTNFKERHTDSLE